MMSEIPSFSLLTSLKTLFNLTVSARDIWSFVGDIDDKNLLSCVDVFLVLMAIVGIDLDLFD